MTITLRSGSEHALWVSLRKRLAVLPGLFVERVENAVGAGMPDVYVQHPACGSLWVELKYLRAFPQTDTHVVALAHFRDEQRAWLRRHAACGGRACVLLQVGREYFFLRGRTAAEYAGRSWTAAGYRAVTHAYRGGLPEGEALLTALQEAS